MNMNFIQTIAAILVLAGACFMVASIVFSVKTLASVPSSFRQRWTILTCLMIFFLGGYLTFVFGLSTQARLHMDLVAGLVFCGGAVFVSLIINLSRRIIAKLREGEKLLRTARDELEVRVQQRTKDLKTALHDLQKESHERRKVSSDLEKSNTDLLQILNSAADGIRVVDKDFIMRRVNKTFAAMADMSQDELIGMHCYEVFRSPACNTDKCSLTQVFAGKKQINKEIDLHHKDGRVTPCIVNASPYYSPDGELVGIVEGFRDITDRKKMEDRLKEISITDELTGLLNRRGFLSVAEKQLELGLRLEKAMFLLYADLDNMKWINDKLGHKVGDQALLEATEVLVTTFRKSDVIGIGRLGGDEFAVLLFSEVPVTGCQHPVLQRLDQHIEERNNLPDRQYVLAMSVGVVSYSPDTCRTLEEFISKADTAMYECKRKRKEGLVSRNGNTME